MVRFNVSTTIFRPLAIIYDYLTTPDNYPTWQSELTAIQAPQGMKAGSTVRFIGNTMGVPYDVPTKVLANNGSSMISFGSRHGTIQFTTTYTLRRVSDHETIVEVEVEADPSNYLRLAEPALASIGRARNSADLATLKVLLDAKTEHVELDRTQ